LSLFVPHIHPLVSFLLFYDIDSQYEKPIVKGGNHGNPDAYDQGNPKSLYLDAGWRGKKKKMHPLL